MLGEDARFGGLSGSPIRNEHRVSTVELVVWSASSTQVPAGGSSPRWPSGGKSSPDPDGHTPSVTPLIPRFADTTLGELDQQLPGMAESWRRVGMTEDAKPVAGERGQTNGWLRRLPICSPSSNGQTRRETRTQSHGPTARTSASRGVARLPNGWLAIGADLLHVIGLVRPFSNLGFSKIDALIWVS